MSAPKVFSAELGKLVVGEDTGSYTISVRITGGIEDLVAIKKHGSHVRLTIEPGQPPLPEPPKKPLDTGKPSRTPAPSPVKLSAAKAAAAKAAAGVKKNLAKPAAGEAEG